MNHRTQDLDPLFDIAPLRDQLANGSLILTPNLRLSRKIRDAWMTHNNSKTQTWEAAQALPLDAWIDERWLQLVDRAYPPALAGPVVTPAQALWLWEEVIASEAESNATVKPQNMAALLSTTWPQVRQWLLDLHSLANSYHRGAKALCRWGLAWEQALAARGLISPEQRTQIVAQGFLEGDISPLPGITLVGFQTLAPIHQQLLDGATENLRHLPAGEGQPVPRQISIEDIDTEIASAAHWARTCARQNPRARIGIVAPNLAQLRKKVVRLFTNEFDPGWCWPHSPYRPEPFNISAATPLADTPLASAALALLALNRRQLESPLICNLLDNPFWEPFPDVGEREGELRSQLTVAVLDIQQARISSGLFRRLAASVEGDIDTLATSARPSLANRLTQLASELRQSGRRYSFAHWRQIFTEQLKLLGWPGSRPLDSLEYQQFSHWQDVLDQFERLDQVATPATLDDALRQLGQLARAASFQAETPDAQIQILGVLEAAGLSFSHLWIMQMDDRHWPAATEPNPLLPAALQRELGMPRSCPRRELSLSNSYFRLLCANSGEVVLSYARREGDTHFQPSTLLAEIPQTTDLEQTARHPWVDAIANSAALELAADDQGPRLPTLTAPLPRGASFLGAQANCPFNAFATFRLGAEPLPQPSSGLTPMERGNLIHYSLEYFWRHASGQTDLLGLEHHQLREQLDKAVYQGLQRLQRQLGLRLQVFGQRYLGLEKERLLRVLERWFEFEQSRGDFVIEHTELPTEVSLDGLGVRLRIDRVDRLGDGGRVIIDYKTGNPSVNPLGGERLTEPQLALYALAVGEPLTTLGYGVINGRQTKFTGLSTAPEILEGSQPAEKFSLPDTWTKILEIWRNKLNLLAKEVKNGEASLVFYSTQALQYGGELEPLNRLLDAERILRWTADAPTGGEGGSQ